MLSMTDYTTTDPISQGIQWLGDAQNWQGVNGIPTRLVEHLGYGALTLLISLVIAVPIGLYVGHTGRGRVVVVSLAAMFRALPTLGMITLFALLSTLGLMPAIWALVLLAIPPLLTGVYAGISSVDRGIVDSARSMGMTEWQILFGVEVPNGLKVMLGGFRGGVLQVLATVAVVAYLPLGGLGRYLIDGVSSNDYGQVFGGAVLIAVLAIVIDGLLALLTRFLVSPGLRITARPAAATPSSEKTDTGDRPVISAQGGTS